MAELMGGFASLDARTERARNAVKVFRSMQPQLTAYARTITKNKTVRVQVAKAGESAAYTDGKVIYFIPPLALGDMRPHNRALCDKRDENLRQRCPACETREFVLSMIYHEIAHICYDSFQPVSDNDKARITADAVSEGGTKFAKKLQERYDKAPAYVKNSYKGLASLFNEFLPLITNALEDARVNRDLFAARAGMKVIFESKARSIFTDGVQQSNGTVMQWRDYPENLQVIIGCFVKASGYDYHGWLHPKVESDLGDAELSRILRLMNSIRDASGVYNLSFKVLERLRALGYCKSEHDEPDEEETEDGIDTQAPADGDADDDAEEGSGEGDDPVRDDTPAESSDSGDEESPDSTDGGEESERSDEPGEPGDDADADGSEGPEADDGSAPGDEAADGGDQGGGESSSDGRGRDDEDVPGEPDEGDGGSGDGTDPDGDDGPGGGDGPSGHSDDGSGGDAPERSEDRPDDGSAPDGGSSDDSEGAGGSGSGEGSGSQSESSDPIGPESHDSSGDDDDVPGEGAPDQHGDLASEGDSGEEGASGGAPESEGEQDSDDPGESDLRSGGVGAPADADGDQHSEDDADGDGDGTQDPGEPNSGAGPEADEPADDLTDGSDQGQGPDGDNPGVSGDASGESDDDGDRDDDWDQGDDAGSPEASAQPGTDSSSGTSGEGRDSRSASDDGGSADPAGDTEPPDTGADTGQGGVEIDDPPVGGSAVEIAPLVAEWLGHGEQSQAEKRQEAADVKDIMKAILQGTYFETPSSNILGVREYRYKDIAPDELRAAWRPGADADVRQWLGIDADLDVPPAALAPALMRMRVAFSDNKRAQHQRNLKAGKINSRVLGKRVHFEDPRLFKRTVLPGKRDYIVGIALDVSGSTTGVNIGLMRRAVMAQATLLDRMGIKFFIFAHSGNNSDYGTGTDMTVYWVKEAEEQWSTEVQLRLRELGPDAYNLDGHAMEFLRKKLDVETATDKIGLYYSDGKMPAFNHDEELDILQREIRVFEQKRYVLLGVGIRTDSPERHGLPTVQVDTDEDLVKVVQHIEQRLVKGR